MTKRSWWITVVATVVLATACGTAAPSTQPTGAPTNPPIATATPGPTDAPVGTATPGPTDAPVGTATPGPTDAPVETATPGPTDAPAAAVPAVPTGYAELDTALTAGADGKMPFAGKKVTIQVQWIGGEGDNFENSLADFEAATGIDIVVDRVGSSHETTLKIRIDGNDPNLDLAMLAQPAAILAYGEDGKLVDVSTFMTGTKLADEHPATVGLYTDASGHVWSVPYKVDVKSTVWYPIKAFAAAGYDVPTTWEELVALSQKIVDDGNGNPWCVGMEAGTATGWQATDWLEDIMLRTTSLDNYNKWITHELPFNSPEVLHAMDLAGQIFFTDGFVFGGPEGAIAIHQTDPMDPMFPADGASFDGFTPACWMQKQATWYGPDFFPDVKANPGTPTIYPIGTDIGLFYFPPIDPAYGNPALGAGDALMVIQPPDGSALADEVKAVAEFLSLPQGVQRWIEAGSAISANQDTPDAWYAGFYKLAAAADIVANATSFGFDASDLMPAEVGAGSEWQQLSEWIRTGGTNPTAQQAVEAIDASWPTP